MSKEIICTNFTIYSTFFWGVFAGSSLSMSLSSSEDSSELLLSCATGACYNFRQQVNIELKSNHIHKWEKPRRLKSADHLLSLSLFLLNILIRAFIRTVIFITFVITADFFLGSLRGRLGSTRSCRILESEEIAIVIMNKKNIKMCKTKRKISTLIFFCGGSSSLSSELSSELSSDSSLDCNEVYPQEAKIITGKIAHETILLVLGNKLQKKKAYLSLLCVFCQWPFCRNSRFCWLQDIG